MLCSYFLILQMVRESDYVTCLKLPPKADQYKMSWHGTHVEGRRHKAKSTSVPAGSTVRRLKQREQTVSEGKSAKIPHVRTMEVKHLNSSLSPLGAGFPKVTPFLSPSCLEHVSLAICRKPGKAPEISLSMKLMHGGQLGDIWQESFLLGVGADGRAFSTWSFGTAFIRNGCNIENRNDLPHNGDIYYK